MYTALAEKGISLKNLGITMEQLNDYIAYIVKQTHIKIEEEIEEEKRKNKMNNRC